MGIRNWKEIRRVGERLFDGWVAERPLVVTMTPASSDLVAATSLDLKAGGGRPNDLAAIYLPWRQMDATSVRTLLL